MSRINETEVSPGVVSSMRITLRVVRRVGTLMVVSSILLAAAMIIFNRGFETVPIATLLAAAGPAMITGIGTAKSWQAQAEEKARMEAS